MRFKLVYNGQRSPYPYSTDVRDIFQDKELFDQVGLGTFKLVDLTIADEEDILKRGKLALFEMLQKHIRVRDFNNAIKFIMNAILVAHDDNLSKDLFDSAWTYLAEARVLTVT